MPILKDTFSSLSRPLHLLATVTLVLAPLCQTPPAVRAAQPEPATPAASQEATPPTPKEILYQYLREPDPNQRKSLARDFASACEDSYARANRLVEETWPWSVQDLREIKQHPSSEMAFTRERGGKLVVLMAAPIDFDVGQRSRWRAQWVDRAYLQNKASEASATTPLQPESQDSGASPRTAVFTVSVRKPNGRNEEIDPSALSPSDLRELISAICRRWPIDPNRIVLSGADDDWSPVLWTPDVFAFARRSGWPVFPYPNATYPFLLGNLRHSPVEVVRDVCGDPEHTHALHAMRIGQLARQFGWPICYRIRFEESAAHAHTTEYEAAKRAHAAGHMLADGCCLNPEQREAATRDPCPRLVAHWFREPEAGRECWLRALSMEPPLWTADQLAIKPAATTDRESYVREVIQSMMAFVGGKIDGQTLTLETSKVGRIEILLYEEMFDFGKPVTIVVNGQKRHEGMISPDIEDMLQHAFETYDFEHPLRAVKRFRTKRDGQPAKLLPSR